MASTGIHAEHLPTWQKCSGVKSGLKVAHDSLAYILPGFDGITAASLKLSASKDTTIAVNWDFTDTSGKSVAEGKYYYCIETANIKKDSIPGAGYVPATVISETTRGSIVTRRRQALPGAPTANIKSLSIAVSAAGEGPKVVDGTTGATK